MVLILLYMYIYNSSHLHFKYFICVLSKFTNCYHEINVSKCAYCLLLEQYTVVSDILTFVVQIQFTVHRPSNWHLSTKCYINLFIAFIEWVKITGCSISRQTNSTTDLAASHTAKRGLESANSSFDVAAKY